MVFNYMQLPAEHWMHAFRWCGWVPFHSKHTLFVRNAQQLCGAKKMGFFRGMAVWQNWNVRTSFCASCENTGYLETWEDLSIFAKKKNPNLMLYVRCLRVSVWAQLLFAQLLRGRRRPLTLISPLFLLGTLHWGWVCIPRCRGNRQTWLADPREPLEFLIKWVSGFFSV